MMIYQLRGKVLMIGGHASRKHSDSLRNFQNDEDSEETGSLPS